MSSHDQYEFLYPPIGDDARAELTAMYERADAARGEERRRLVHELWERLETVHGVSAFETTTGLRVKFDQSVSIHANADPARLVEYLDANGGRAARLSNSTAALEEWARRRARDPLGAPPADLFRIVPVMEARPIKRRVS